MAVTRFLSEVAFIEIDDRGTGQGVDFRGEAGHGRSKNDRQHDAEDAGGSIAEEERGKDVVHLGGRLIPHHPPEEIPVLSFQAFQGAVSRKIASFRLCD